MGALVALVEKFFLAIPAKTYLAAIGAIAYAIYQATQGNWNEAILTILAAFGFAGVRGSVTRSTNQTVQATEDQTDHLSKVTIEAAQAARPDVFIRRP